MRLLGCNDFTGSTERQQQQQQRQLEFLEIIEHLVFHYILMTMSFTELMTQHQACA